MCTTIPSTLPQMLLRAAKSSSGITLYDDWEGHACKFVSYHALLERSLDKAKYLRSLPRARRETVVLLHFASFQENLEWFWGVVIAGIMPAVSTPLPADPSRRRIHLAHLRDTLRDPIVLTSQDLIRDFEGVDGLDLLSIDQLGSVMISCMVKHGDYEAHPEDAGALMLTSGSSGNTKVVVLRHEQIIASVQGKSQCFSTTQADVFMNWIGFDHVASLIETHFHAVYLCANLIHIPAETVIARPLIFPQLVDRHRITYTFAPHFFLARLKQSMETDELQPTALDLSCLTHIISGGEANLVETAATLTELLRKHKLRGDVIRPGFGMTETCAGSIYSKDCPKYDLAKRYPFASLGKPIPGIEMRIVSTPGHEAAPGSPGDLQVAGNLVFKEYFNNPTATATSFTEDSWFMTGDRAFIDAEGNLNIAGREKETINLNGLKYFPHEIEMALENANIVGITPSFTAIFSCRPLNTHAEELCVVYHPRFDVKDVVARVETARNIGLVVSSFTLTWPKHILPLPRNLLHKSALGKLSRTKLRVSFEEGKYNQYQDSNNPLLKKYKITQRKHPSTPIEQAVFTILQGILDVPGEELGVTDSLFDLGITSTGLFVLKRRIELHLRLGNPLAIGLFLTIPTIRGIANELKRLGQESRRGYNPVVPLQSNHKSTKAPLWLVHPGSGDILVFVALAKQFSDRTVYGLRTRGLNTGLDEENYFSSIAEIADLYVENIKQHQGKGPYAIAGYSLGSTVAFEIGKRFEAAGEQVAFLGLLDSPPHMRRLIERLDWIDVLINVAYFLELIDENFSASISEDLHQRSPDEALDFILASASRERLEVLSIDKARLHKLTDVTDAFGQAGKRYNPDGMVHAMDVFWVTPLQSVAENRREWMDKHLIDWKDYSAEFPRFHECEGCHSKMLNLEYIASFQRILKSALIARGI